MKIICVGRNYLKHIEELNNEVPQEPIIFIKPDSALLRNNAPFFIPEFSNDVHYEVELVIKIKKLGRHIPVDFAADYIDSIALGIDFTARDKQAELKAKGLPWEKSKGFDHSAVISAFMPTPVNLESLDFRLEKNGEVVQRGNSSMMIHRIPNLISHISEYFTLKIGDHIYTGTPEGVGPVQSGDRLKGFIEETLMFDFAVR
jgi:2-keto-4-pentenoate hydratase/2-oxohepta-3-ene-1,7-dioic acid hydratase in catechol pathway